jgi:TolA-binding protein
MDTCGEHGDDIAYSGRNCPACGQIEDINSDHNEVVNDLNQIIEDLQEQVDEYEDRIDALNEENGLS